VSALARIVLDSAATVILLGGLYDLLVPKLPSNLVALCGDNEPARKLVRELLRALGGSLVAIGGTVALLVNELHDRRRTVVIVLLLVLPSEGVNAISMYRVGSPFFVPLAILGLTILGVLLAWR
jgi:uncharacterized membrane protein YhaH (DUF805 family)